MSEFLKKDGEAIKGLEQISHAVFMGICKDAERYRFLSKDFSVMGANIDGNHSWVYRRNFSLRGVSLDAAIDAAIEAQK